MIKSAKAIAANTDLSSAQPFIFQTLNFSLGLIIYGEGDDVFLKIKQAVLEVESLIRDESDPMPSKFIKLYAELVQKLSEVESLQMLFIAWTEDILYLESHGHHYATLSRQNELINLITPEQQARLISGHIQAGDKILLGTQSLTEAVGEITDSNQDIHFVFKSSVSEFQDQIDVLVLDKPHLDPIATILIEVDQPAESNIIPLHHQPSRYFKLPRLSLPRRLSLQIGLPRHFRPRFLAAVLVILILLGGGVFFGWRKFKSPSLNPQVNSLITQAQTKLSTAQSLAGLNSEEAKANLTQAIELVNQATKLDSKNQAVISLKQQIDAEKFTILKYIEVKDWPVYLKLDLIKDQFNSKTLSYSTDNFLLFDNNTKTLVMLDKKQKTNTILAGSRQLGNATHASINGDFSFTYSPDKGVVRIDNQNQKDTLALKVDSDWGFIADLYGFGTNIYLLDSGKNQIWKYTPTPSGYSDKIEYLKAPATLTDASKLQIDSSVWVLKGGDILKFTQGNRDFYSVSGIDQPINSISTFYVSDETDHLYLIDPDNSRLVVTDKNGKYTSQYVGDKFKTASDLVVDEINKKIYLLEGNKIYLIDLK